MDPHGFHTFGRDHLATLAVLAALGILVAWIGRGAQTAVRTWCGRALGLLLAAYAMARYTQLAHDGQLSWAYSLPLELCHWVLIACVVALFFHAPPAAEIAYFWGFGGTLQAVLTPDVYEGFPSWEFIQFFWSHGGILLAIIYLVAARRFMPQRGSVLRMMLAANFYLVFVGALDWIFGWNYGYLRQPPAQPSLLDYLGPWPWYILSLEVIALASFWLLSLPWRLLRTTSISK